MSERDSERPDAMPTGPFGYAPCPGCGVAVRRRVLADGHHCDPERYADHQASRLHWKHHGFDDAVRAWLATPRGAFAQFYARRLLHGQRAPRPGEA